MDVWFEDGRIGVRDSRRGRYIVRRNVVGIEGLEGGE
jgi:hypothetical protein